LVCAVTLLAACSSSGSDGKATANGGAGGAGNGGSGNSSNGGGTLMAIPTVPGQVDPNAPAGTALKPVPALVNVKAAATGDSVSLSFDPIDGAVDYRVYELPDNANISTSADGVLTVKNAVYRCAGNRQAPAVTMDAAPQVPSGGARTLVDGQDVNGYKRSLAEATLGYVWAVPGDGRVPVYALGDSDAKADVSCYFMRWNESRVKQYVTSTDDRDQLLKKGFRDDGIAFYVPAAADATTVQIYTSTTTDARMYFPDGPEVAKRMGAQPAFIALAKAADGTLPLMRVYYANMCGTAHDELVAGQSRFNRARAQGDKVPVYGLHWSGLTKQTTLVVEALDAGCPFPGLLSSQSVAAYTSPDLKIPYASWSTPMDVQAASATGELFINGQAAANSKPRPMARSFVKISPAAAPDLDWSYGFKADDTLGPFADEACGALDGNCYGQYRQNSPTADAGFFAVEEKRHAVGDLFGQLWVTFSDIEGDTNGKFRVTPSTKADMAADSFLYARMEVDTFSTGRRYPQILISDRDAPVQTHLPEGNTLVLQTFGDWPNVFELQVCDHKTWDVNDQCPRFDFYNQYAAGDTTKVKSLAPVVEVGEHSGLDRATLLEIYTSTTRAYLFIDGQPHGCAILPKTGVPSGAATVTFGDVLYHSSADVVFDFSGSKLHNDTIRSFDNLGFKSHVVAPPWDETRFPCTATLGK